MDYNKYKTWMHKQAEESRSNDYLAGAGIGAVVGKKLGGTYDATQLMKPGGSQVFSDVQGLWSSNQKGRSILKALGAFKGTAAGGAAGALGGVGIAHLMRNRDIPRNEDGTPVESWTDHVTGTTGGIAGGLLGAGYGAFTGVGREQNLRNQLEQGVISADESLEAMKGSDFQDRIPAAENRKNLAEARLEAHRTMYGETASPTRARLMNAAGKGIGGAVTGAILGYGVNRFANMGKDKLQTEGTSPSELSKQAYWKGFFKDLSGANVRNARKDMLDSVDYDIIRPDGTVQGDFLSNQLKNANQNRKKAIAAAGLTTAGVGLGGYGAYRYFNTPEEKTASTWTRKEGQNPEGGLNQKGRDAYNRETGGNLKRPVSKEEASKSDKAASRRKSFCARMSGMKKKMTGSDTARDPDSRINKALRKWDC